MYYRGPHQPQNQRFFGFGFGLPFLGGLAGGLLGSALIGPRPFYGYPPPPPPPPPWAGPPRPCCPPGYGYQY
ncbi:hypothetical protein FZC79_15335 [Rossellomorea vietnamensis]|uniref:Uncharacterized protein n=2 Tax=Rossellomorea TaxID=2837508 RepID=A0A5D4KA01_9BACI|nr:MULTISPECIES: hypothetical protein [Rossellomorea]TYR74187.1 hypothetical protein FZC79_15335 [Rossellomorea vietnamensis]TYS79709.1 hypothetical protein FZC80_08670 [Rossellomorea aquimaris]